ncbi:MAG: hypothetical protein L6R38_002153 [Xanthoria sp. 2 TBL-2021]|nr:MAG: hypothetical protein L6R38_002153 [Xanthoria sp. 2 TBL-2021]
MSGIYLSHERQNIMPPMPPPLSMEPPTSIDRNGPAYPTPSSASATIPTSLPRSPQEPQPTHTVVDGKRYSLEIVQQPVRARMCGFGDKDRRPITPPPCIRLVVQEANHPYAELDINQIDTAFFVLTVDLWNAEGTKEVNLVRHSQTSPSISAATSTSYPPPTMIQNPFGLQTTPYLPGNPYTPLPHQSFPNQHQQQQQQLYPAPSQGYHSHPYQHPIFHGQQFPMPPQQSQNQSYYMNPSPPSVAPGGYNQPSHMAQYQHPLTLPQQLPRTATDPTAATPTPPGMFTRNLIGSLGVSAFKLTDPDNAMGIWFILQDLSVRTEGNFRLKMNFVNVGSPPSSSNSHGVNSGSAPVLASCFSHVFQVYSAKKFPGVIESTHLSKCFATQGIKIPIRKDGPRGNERRDEDGDE